MLVSEILEQKGKVVFTINENDVIYKAVKKLHDYKIGSLLVVNNNDQLTGIISERDIIYKCYTSKEAMLETKVTVKERMTGSEKIVVGKLTDTATKMMNTMIQKKIRHIPIIDDEGIVGLISIGDVLKAIIDDGEQEANLLKEHIQNPLGIHLYNGNK
ncbi:MAG: CBS domain-containing protein [Ichthyobacteriaceae bacterium]|nr:CBS domain-containing protein [Ichthyobacteriaceae bacterium]